MSIFESNGIFDDDRVLHHDSHTPTEIVERDTQKDELVSALKSVYRGSPPKNIVLRGNNGTGKTSLTKSMLATLSEDCAKKGINVTRVYVNCSTSNDNKSSYHVSTEITNALRKNADPSGFDKISNGYSSSKVYRKMFEEIENAGDTTIIVLDELDCLKNDEILYKLSRATTNGDLNKDTDVGLIGITNDSSCIKSFSTTVRDSLCEELIEFSPYNSDELEAILNARKDTAFVDGALEGGVVPLCSAITAKDTGSARQALKLLKKAGEIADDENADNVTTEHVDIADTRIDKDNVKNSLKALTIQEQLALLTVATKSLDPSGSAKKVPTSDLHVEYKTIAQRHGHSARSKNRFSDRLGSLQQQNIINLTRTRKSGNQNKYNLEVDPGLLIEAFDEIISDAAGGAPDLQKTVEKIMFLARGAGEVSPSEITLQTCKF